MRNLALILSALLAGFCFGKPVTIHVTSTAFKASGLIPARYTCDGENMSPAVAWDTVPAATKSIALIADDPDAPMGTWVHWVVYNLPSTMRALKEGIPTVDTLINGGYQGINDFEQVGYGGPCPPNGTHRYFFKVYALDTLLALSGKVTKQQLEKAMKGHILGQGELVGRYSRK